MNPSNVSYKMSFLNKTFATLLALEWSLSSVGPFMIL